MAEKSFNDDLEPAIKTVEITADDIPNLIASIAVSLKRIADAVDQPNQFGTIGTVLDGVRSQLEYIMRK